MKKYTNVFVLLMVVITTGLLLSFATVQDKKDGGPWNVPEKYKAMQNAHKGDEGLVKIGKMHYIKHCKSCHGGDGLGDGPKAASMKTKMNSFKSAEFQSQNDGVIYYQSFIGRDEMPNFESKIPDDEDRWAVVNYLRTLK